MTEQCPLCGQQREPLRPWEVAEIMAIHINTLKRIPPSDLPYEVVRPRGDRRYRRADVERYLEARRVAGRV